MSADEPIEVDRTFLGTESGLKVWEITDAASGAIVGYDYQASS